MSGEKPSRGEIIGIALLVGFVAAILILVIVRSRESKRRSACVNNQYHLHLALSMYAVDNEKMFPPIDNTRNNFIFEGESLYPEYLQDETLTMCPADPAFDPPENFRLRSIKDHHDFSTGEVHPDCVTDKSYIYLGWQITSDEEAEAFFRAYDRMSPKDYAKDILNPDDGSIEIVALSRGKNVDPFFGAQFSDWEEAEAYMDSHGIVGASESPVMWERPYTDPSRFSHQPAGGHVVYLDGHVEFIRYGEKFPITETMARLLDERPRERIPDCDE